MSKEKVVKEETLKKEQGTCGQCRWLDPSSRRDFFRKVGKKDSSGQRTTIKEIRGKCTAPKEHCKAGGHLVDVTSTRPCFKRGTFVAPEKKEEQPVKKEETGKERGRPPKKEQVKKEEPKKPEEEVVTKPKKEKKSKVEPMEKTT